MGLQLFCKTKCLVIEVTVDADPAVGVDVGVEHLRHELHLRGLVWVVVVEFKRQLELTVLPYGSLCPLDKGFPFVEIVINRIGADPRTFFLFPHLGEVFDESLLCVSGHFLFTCESVLIRIYYKPI